MNYAADGSKHQQVSITIKKFYRQAMLFRVHLILFLTLLLALCNVALACDPVVASWRESEKTALRQAPVAFYGTVTKITEEPDAQVLTIRIAPGSNRGIKGSRAIVRYSLDGGSAACNFDKQLSIQVGDRFGYLGSQDVSVFSSRSPSTRILEAEQQSSVWLLYFDYFYIFPRECSSDPTHCKLLKHARRALLRRLRAINQ